MPIVIPAANERRNPFAYIADGRRFTRSQATITDITTAELTIYNTD